MCCCQSAFFFVVFFKIVFYHLTSAGVPPEFDEHVITYADIFPGVDVTYTNGRTKLKQEIVLSQTARDRFPAPQSLGLSPDDAFLMVAVEFDLTPANLRVFARVGGDKIPVRQGNRFAFEGTSRIDFEDENEDLHFFFPMDVAYAAADSANGFAGAIEVLRYFYSDRGKHFLLIGVPWTWLETAPAGR